MSKTKKIMSMILVAVMVMTMFPMGTSLTATAASDVAWNTPASAPAGVSAVVSGTKVIRVAYGANSYLYGTTIVAATPDGIPYSNGQYAHLGYAGQTHNLNEMTPRVSITFGQKVDGTPALTATSMKGYDSYTNVTFTNISATNGGKTFTYDYNINAGLSAYAGDTLLYTFTYYINGTEYKTYHTVNVRELQSPVGKASYGYRSSLPSDGTGTIKSRLGHVFTLQCVGLYGRIGYSSANNGWGTSGNGDVGNTASKQTSDERAQVNWNCASLSRSTSSDQSLNLVRSNASNVQWPSVYTNKDLIKRGSTSTKEFTQNGWDDDENRSRGDIYIDRSSLDLAQDVATQLGFKTSLVRVDGTEGDTWGNVSMNAYHVTFNGNDVNFKNNDYGDYTHTSEEYSHFRMYTMWDNGIVVNGTALTTEQVTDNLGGQLLLPVTGDLFTGSTSYISANSDSGKGNPQRISVTFSLYSRKASKYAFGVTSNMDLYVYVTDKSDLRNVINVISGASASCSTSSDTNINRSLYSAQSFTPTKGVNPQPNAFTTDSYNTYIAAYKNACMALTDGKSYNQIAIAQATANLISAYNNLQRVSDTVVARLYLENSTTVVPGTNASGYTSGTYYAGDTAVATAPDVIGGYKRVSPATQDVTVTNDTPDIIFYYAADEYTYTFDPVEVDAGGNNGDGVTGVKTKTFKYGQDYTLSSYAPVFVYNGYTIEGWYQSYNRTTKAYSNKVSDSYTVSTTGAKTLYAKWQLAPVTIHYNIAMTGQTMADVQLNPGDSLASVEPADPDYEGFAFGGWYTDQTFSTPFDWSATVPMPYVNNTANPDYVTDITAYAKFTTFGGKIVFEENGGENVTDIDLSTYADNAIVTLPTPTRMGYNFVGWYSKSDFSGTQYTTITATPTMKTSGIGLYAKWTPKSITLSFDIKYNAATASPIDTTTNPAPITGYVDSSIVDTCNSTGQALPGTPVRYGWDFKGWTKNTNKKNQEFTTLNAYNQAVNNGYRYDVEESTAVFQATDDTAVTLYPMWVKNTNNAYINLDTYKMMSGVAVSTNETDISNGDIVTVRMTATTNFYTGSSTFVYMYNKNFYELVGTGTDAFTLNGANDYISAINGTADYFGYTGSDSSLVPAGVTYPAGTTAADYNWIQISIDPDVNNGYIHPGASAGGSYMLQFKLRVKATTLGTTGTVFMDNAWSRTPDNNGGTMFFGCCASSADKVWESYNNVVTPDLTFATSTVTLKADNSTETTVTVDPNGGTWPDDSTGTKSYTGDAEEEILNYVGTPSKFGYTFVNFTKQDDSSAVWAEGYYATVANNNATYIAQWDGLDVVNTFKYNDGTSNGTEKTSKYGSTIVLPTAPTRTGYDFAGWSVDDQATTGSLDLGTQNSIYGTIYHAVWTPKTDTPFTIAVKYTNNQTGSVTTTEFPTGGKTTYGAADGSTVNAFGTTGATVHIVPDAQHQEDTATDIYIKYSELPKVQNGNYIFDPTNTANLLTTTVSADGSGYMEVNYIGKLTTTTFSANNGTFAVPSPAKQIDTSKEAAYGTGNGEGYSYTADAAEFYLAYAKKLGDLTVIEPTRTGYTFGGWGSSATTTTATNFTSVVANKNATYYAIWNGNTIANTFNANGGAWTDGDTEKSVDSTVGKAITKPATNPEKAGYTFLGWDVDNDNVADTLGNQGVDAKTYKAVWQLNDQTYNIDVYYMGTDGTYGEKDACSTTGSGIGGVTVASATYAKDGFTFDETNSNVSITLNESTVGVTQTIVIKFTRNKYNVTYKVDGVQSGDVESVYWGAALVVRDEPTKEGYTFSGWKKNDAAVPAAMPKENITISGTFSINSYTLTVNYFYPDGTTPIAPAHTETVNYNAAYSVNSPAVTGYTAGTVTVTGNMPADDKVVNVTYTINSYPLTIHYKYGNGSQAKPDYTGNVAYNASYSVDSPAITGYTADKAVISGVMGTTAVTVTVTYTVNTHYLTVNYVFAEGGTAATQYKQAYNYGQSYSVASPAVTGYTPNVATVANTMGDDDVTITVTYTANQYKLTVRYYDAGDATPAKHEEMVTYGATYNVPTPEVTGYTANNTNVTGIMPDAEVAVAVYYTINSYQLTVKYQYADGRQAAPDATQTVNYNAAYTVASPTVTGYTPDKATVTGTMGAAAKTEVVTYTVNTYTLTVKFEDAAGNKLADDAVYNNVAYNTAYNYGVAAVTGYTPAKNAVTGTMGAADKTETVTYTINSYELKFVAPKLLANGTLSTVNTADASTYTLVSGSIVEYKAAVTAPEAKVIENYTFNSWSPAVPATMPAADTFIVASYDRVEVTLEGVITSNVVIDTEVDETNTIDGYIYGIESCLTVAKFEEDYVTVIGNGHLVVTPAYNYRKFNTVGTGTKVELVDDVTNEVVETYYVVVYGDLNGDGFCDVIDVAMMREEIGAVNSTSILDGTTKGTWTADASKTAAPQMKAADLDGNGTIDANDLAKLKDVAGYCAEINQATRAITYYGA